MSNSDGYLSDDAYYWQGECIKRRARERYRKRPEQAGYDNARFWIYLKGWVKLTLRPGQMLNHVQSEPTDEGWKSQAYTITHSGPRVVVISIWRGQDCDGRLDRYSTYYADLDSLRARLPYSDDIEKDTLKELVPEWTEASSSQRDYTAEAMGY